MVRLTSSAGLVLVGLVAPACYCFGGATWIATPRGRRRLRNIRVGDWVLSFEGRTGRVVESQVERVFSHGPRAIGRLGDAGPRAVTPNHPILDEQSGEYIRADELHARSSRLLAWNGKELVRRRAQAFSAVGAVEPVFNRRVAETGRAPELAGLRRPLTRRLRLSASSTSVGTRPASGR